MYNNITEEMIKIKENCFVNQTSYNDCGLACLTMILKNLGVKTSLEELKKDFNYNGDDELSVYDIVKLSKKKGIEAQGYKKVLIQDIPCSSIAHIIENERQHFVVVIKVLKNKVLVADPARRIMYYDKTDFLKKYTGVIIKFEPKKNPIKLIFKNKKIIIKSVFLSFMLTLLNILFSCFFPLIINFISTNKSNLVIILAIVIFFIIGILKDFFTYIKSSFSVKFQLFIDKFITIPTINKIISLPHMFYHKNGSGELISKINDLSYIKDAIFSFVEIVILNILLVLFSLFIITYINWIIAIICIIFIFISYLINDFYYNKNISKSYDLQYLNEKFNNKLTDTFNFILTIKNLSKENYFKDKIDKMYNNILLKYKEFVTSHQKKDLLINTLTTFFYILNLILLLLKKESLTHILLLFSLQSSLINSVLEVYKLLPLYIDFKNVYYRINEVMKNNEIKETKDNILINNISIKNLKYNYNDKEILKDVSLEINKGDWIMINGPSGSGKTTLFKLLTKQIRYDGNGIYINKKNLCQIDESTLRNSIIYVDQKIRLINESIKDNIFLGEPFDNKVVKTACVNEVLRKNNINYDYIIDNTNSNLSTGQIGKIAIAQAINTKCDFIIFDETTSSLDVLDEKMILENIKKNYKDKTIILITHRKSNVNFFNKIMTFKNGKIISS